MKKVVLPSGAELQIDMAPFADSRALYQALLEEIKGLKIAGSDEIDYNMMKDLLCVGLSSKKIEAALDKCMSRALYNGSRISPATWEPVEARGDYFQAMLEVAKENVLPFTKSLFAELKIPLPQIIKDHASRPQTAIS